MQIGNCLVQMNQWHEKTDTIVLEKNKCFQQMLDRKKNGSVKTHEFQKKTESFFK